MVNGKEFNHNVSIYFIIQTYRNVLKANFQMVSSQDLNIKLTNGTSLEHQQSNKTL